jgi:hypothetical protein
MITVKRQLREHEFTIRDNDEMIIDNNGVFIVFAFPQCIFTAPLSLPLNVMMVGENEAVKVESDGKHLFTAISRSSWCSGQTLFNKIKTGVRMNPVGQRVFANPFEPSPSSKRVYTSTTSCFGCASAQPTTAAPFGTFGPFPKPAEDGSEK